MFEVATATMLLYYLLPPHLSPRPATRPRTTPCAASSIDAPLHVLRQSCATPAAERPTPAEATQALALVANAGVHPDDWSSALSASRWRPVFSAKPDSLKAAAADGRGVPRPQELADASPGRFLNVDAAQTFGSDGRLENTFRLLWGVVCLHLFGVYEMSGRRMTIAFDTLRITLLFGLLRFRLDIRDGSRLRSFIERRVRPRGARAKAKDKDEPFRKRPNVYSWCFADGGLCVAQGSSGSVALWGAVGSDGQPASAPASSSALPGESAPGPASRGGGGAVQMQLRSPRPPRRAMRRARPAVMAHSPEELQLAAALVLPLLAYKASAIVQRVQLQWYLDAAIALATASLIVYAGS